jgi:hypothetical protein
MFFEGVFCTEVVCLQRYAEAWSRQNIASKGVTHKISRIIELAGMNRSLSEVQAQNTHNTRVL